MKEREVTRRDALKLGASLILSTLGTGMALGGLTLEAKPRRQPLLATAEATPPPTEIRQTRLSGAYELIWEKTIPFDGADAALLDTYYSRFQTYSPSAIIKISREIPREKPYRGMLEIPSDLFADDPKVENTQGIELAARLIRSSMDEVLDKADNPDKLRSLSEWIFFWKFQRNEETVKADDIFNPYYQWDGYEEEYSQTQEKMVSHPLDYLSYIVSSLSFAPQRVKEEIAALQTTDGIEHTMYYDPITVKIDEPSKRFAKLALKEAFSCLKALAQPEGEKRGDGYLAHKVEQSLPGFARIRSELGINDYS